LQAGHLRGRYHELDVRALRAFTRAAVTLLALSLVPVWATGFDTASALSLTGLHLTAGAIVIPALRAVLAP
jgi:hypothetical protein